MKISKTIEIDMSHRVPNHNSKCRNLHGHRYSIEAVVDGYVKNSEGASDEGMVIDYTDLKSSMLDVIDKNFDHNAVFYKDDPAREYLEKMHEFQDKKIWFVSFIPTAENLAEFWFNSLSVKLQESNIQLTALRVWETPTSMAEFTPYLYPSIPNSSPSPHVSETLNYNLI